MPLCYEQDALFESNGYSDLRKILSHQLSTLYVTFNNRNWMLPWHYVI